VAVLRPVINSRLNEQKGESEHRRCSKVASIGGALALCAVRSALCALPRNESCQVKSRAMASELLPSELRNAPTALQDAWHTFEALIGPSSSDDVEG
jgi:hypothetical protein